MVTVGDLTPGRDLPSPAVFDVTHVNWNAGKGRRAEVELLDSVGNELRLVDYNGANISTKWQQGHQYCVSQCAVKTGGRGFEVELSPSKRTVIEPLGLSEQTTKFLVVGDTHIGRQKHPRTGEKIDPLTAFVTAVKFGIEAGVDAVVHVGDIFHESATARQTTNTHERVFAPLHEAGIPFYYLKGNHSTKKGDGLLDSSASKHVANLNMAGVALGSHIRLFGVNHYPMGRIPEDKLRFRKPRDEQLSILFLHQTIEQLSGRSNQSVDLSRITAHFRDRFDFIFSGHHHDATHKKWNGVPVMYTGASEKMSTNDNPTDRVAWLIEAENSSISCKQYNIPG